eukprot:2157791-Rhodomonas_salina.1
MAESSSPNCTIESPTESRTQGTPKTPTGTGTCSNLHTDTTRTLDGEVTRRNRQLQCPVARKLAVRLCSPRPGCWEWCVQWHEKGRASGKDQLEAAGRGRGCIKGDYGTAHFFEHARVGR